MCGAVLIDPEWVITARHCKPKLTQKFHFGSTDMFKAPIVRSITFVKELKKGWDVTICKLDKPITNIRPAILNDDKDIKKGIDVYAIGWGQTEKGGLSRNIKQVRMETKGHYDDDDGLMTQRGKGYGMCHGDSGGPLVVNTKKHGLVVLGLASAYFGGKCGDSNTKYGYATLANRKSYITKYAPNSKWADGDSDVIKFDFGQDVGDVKPDQVNSGHGPGCTGYFKYKIASGGKTCADRGLQNGPATTTCSYDSNNNCSYKECCVEKDDSKPPPPPPPPSGGGSGPNSGHGPGCTGYHKYKKAANSTTCADRGLAEKQSSTCNLDSNNNCSYKECCIPISGGGSGSGNCKYDQSQKGKVIEVRNTITVKRDQVFDGKGATYKPVGLGDGGQGENQKKIFQLEKGATLRNLRIAKPGADGVGFTDDCLIENVVWEDVGEDAMSTSSGSGDAKITVINCEFREAKDKAIQFNTHAELYLINCLFYRCSQPIRSHHKMKLKISNCIFDRCGKVSLLSGGKAKGGTNYIDYYKMETKNMGCSGSSCFQTGGYSKQKYSKKSSPIKPPRGCVFNVVGAVKVSTPTPIHGKWSSWKQGTCNKPCGGGTRTDTRTCSNPSPQHGGNPCSGYSTQTVSCNTQACPPPPTTTCFENGKKFGYKLKKITGISEQQCQDACKNDPNCIRADQFKNGNCYLRKMKETSKWTTGTKGGGIVDNKKQFGYKLQKISGTSGIQECKALCDNNVNCSHYDLYKSNGNCYLRYKKNKNGWKTTEKNCTMTRFLDITNINHWYIVGIIIIVLVLLYYGGFKVNIK